VRPLADPTLSPFPPLSRRYEHENGESAWVAPYADDEVQLVNGRKLKAGWHQVGPDADGDIWYENEAGEVS
jgi:hypothetical protein